MTMIGHLSGRKRTDEMIDTEMLCHIEGHHLIGDFGRDAHLQCGLQGGIQITLLQESLRIHPVGGEDESSEIDLPGSNISLIAAEFLSNRPLPDHHPATQPEPFDHFLFCDGFMAGGYAKTEIGLKLSSRGSGAMALHPLAQVKGHGSQFPHPFALISFKKEVTPVDLTHPETLRVP